MCFLIDSVCTFVIIENRVVFEIGSNGVKEDLGDQVVIVFVDSDTRPQKNILVSGEKICGRRDT